MKKDFIARVPLWAWSLVLWLGIVAARDDWSAYWTPSSMFFVGMTVGAIVMHLLTRLTSLPYEKTYRRWYIMCRNTLEDVADDKDTPYETRKKLMTPLYAIGPRTSKRDDWEDTWKEDWE